MRRTAHCTLSAPRSSTGRGGGAGYRDMVPLLYELKQVSAPLLRLLEDLEDAGLEAPYAMPASECPNARHSMGIRPGGQSASPCPENLMEELDEYLHLGGAALPLLEQHRHVRPRRHPVRQ